MVGILWPTPAHADNLTKLWHAWISRVYVCDFVWFRWLLFYFLTGMLCILRQNKNKRVAQNCVLVTAKWKENTARFILCIYVCVRVSFWWKSNNENNYDSMRICCLSNRRVKNVFCVIFVNLTFDSFWFTLFFQRQKIGSVCGCVLVLHQQFYFNIFYSFHYFSSLYSQDLIYQSSLVRGNRKKTVQELFAFSCRPLYNFCLFCLAEV